MTTGVERAMELERLALAIERLAFMTLPELAGATTWVMPAAERCRGRLNVHRFHLDSTASDLRRRALMMRLGHPGPAVQ